MMNKNIFKIIFVMMCCLSSLEAVADLRGKSLTYDIIINSEPRLKEIIDTVYNEEGLTNDHIAAWKRRIKTAPWLPTLYIGYDHALKETEGVGVNDSISISSGIVTMGPADNDYNYDSNLGRTIRLRAVWKLDETVFNSNYFALSKEKRDMAAIRFDVGQKIGKIHEQRLLLLSKYLQLQQTSAAKAKLLYAQYLAFTEKLDALTGGKYRNRWWRQ